jgi:hypothetical protein
LKITLLGNKRDFFFKAATEEECIHWIKLFSQHIKLSLGFKFNTSAPWTENFWKQDQISEKQFIEMADTFDILLFKCNTSGGKIIRSYTKSEFDHAGMVLKFGSEPDEIFFIEATGNQGVSLKRFSGMKYTIGTFYKKIVLRHLDWDRPDSALDVLEQFVNEVQGSQYSFSLRQLNKRKTIALSKNVQLLDESASMVSTRDASNTMTS